MPYALINEKNQISTIKIPGRHNTFQIFPLFMTREEARKAKKNLPPEYEVRVVRVNMQITKPTGGR